MRMKKRTRVAIMPTITVQKQDLYQLAHVDATATLAEQETELQLVKGELGMRGPGGRKNQP